LNDRANQLVADLELVADKLTEVNLRGITHAFKKKNLASMQASFGNIYSTVSLEKEYAVQGFGKIVLFQSVSIYGLQFPTPAIACIYKLRDQDELEELYTKGQTQCLVKVYDGVLFRTCMSHYLYNS